MSQFKKTNAMRILDKAGIEYTYQEYEYDENDLDGHHVAEYLGVPYEEVFKTLASILYFASALMTRSILRKRQSLQAARASA